MGEPGQFHTVHNNVTSGVVRKLMSGQRGTFPDELRVSSRGGAGSSALPKEGGACMLLQTPEERAPAARALATALWPAVLK